MVSINQISNWSKKVTKKTYVVCYIRPINASPFKIIIHANASFTMSKKSIEPGIILNADFFYTFFWLSI